MTELGPDVRVYVAWAPEDELGPGCTNRDSVGTGVIRGNVRYRLSILHNDIRPFWPVDMDNGLQIIVLEDYLYPIDDWNEDLTEKRDRKTEEPA